MISPPESAPTTLRANLVVSDGVPEDGVGRYVHYRNLRAGGAGWRRVDVGPIVHARQDEWLDELDSWHRSLSRQAAEQTSWWWLIPGSRLTAWYPLDLRSLFFALGVIELCSNGDEGTPLYVVAFPDEALGYLEEWATANPGAANITRTTAAPRSAQRGTRASELSWWLATGRLWASIVARWLTRVRANVSRDKPDTVVVSYTLSVDLMRQVGDHFFGRLFEEPGTKPPGRVEWLYLLSSFGERDAIRAYCHSIGRRMRYDFELLRWHDLGGIIADAAAIRIQVNRLSRELPRLKVGRLLSESFPRRFADAAICKVAPVAELAFNRAFRRYLRVTTPATVVFPYEEKGVERAILKLCTQVDTPPKTVAFAHAVFSQGHLYLRRQNELARPHPKVIATTGPAMRDWMLRWAKLPSESLVVSGSPRFAPRDDERQPAARLRVLFIASYGYEIGQIATMVEELPNLFDGSEIMVRRYRHDWHAEQNEGISNLKRLGVVLRPDEGSLSEQIKWADVVLFSSTSAGIEAALRGRITLRIVGDVFDADPMYGRDEGKDIPQCASAGELKAWLAAIQGMDQSGYASMVDRQYRVASSIYAPLDGPVWRQTLEAPSPRSR